jgi:hypothetical protein
VNPGQVAEPWGSRTSAREQPAQEAKEEVGDGDLYQVDAADGVGQVGVVGQEGCVLTAGVEAFGGFAAARQGTRPIGREEVIGPDGQPFSRTDENGVPSLGAFRTRDDFEFVNEASSVLDGLSDWRAAERVERQARGAVEQAEQALDFARASGDRRAIQEAEANLRQARRGLVSAELGRALALDNAAQRFTSAVVEWKELGRAEVLRTRAGDKAARLAAVLDDPRASPGDRAAALERFARLSLAAREYEQAVASGDGERMRAARLALEQTQDELGPLAGLVRVAAVVGQDRDSDQGTRTDAGTTTSAGRREVEAIDRRLPWLADYGKPPAEAAPPTGTWYEELLLWREEQQGRFIRWLSSLGRSAGEGAIAERPASGNSITRQQLIEALEQGGDPALAEAIREEAKRYAHHIVAGTSGRAAEARAILERFGMSSALNQDASWTSRSTPSFRTVSGESTPSSSRTCGVARRI